MTTVQNAKAKKPPRFMVRTFWALHKAINRFGGGRLGLWPPRAGKRFGVMRLDTIGRRSGRSRTVLLGYFEDGPNLVTLAMNGWADPEPAWWLNLQADPHATVSLRKSTRSVRARTAQGAERERLWLKLSGYPGWGDDIDALVAGRSRTTTVVVLEPA